MLCAELTRPCVEFFDVKFYPYDPIGSDPVFAAVSKKHVRDHLSACSTRGVRISR